MSTRTSKEMPTRSPSLEKVVENDNANENVESLDHGVLNLKLLSPLGITIVLLTGFAQLLDNISLSGVTLALPNIGEDLGIEGTELSYMISAYAISFGSLLLLAGGLSDRYGQKMIFSFGILLVGICSLIISFMDSVITILVLRGIQGIGAAASVPSALGFLSLAFREEDRKPVLAIFGAFGGVGFTLGLILGGLVSSTVGWRWIFRIISILAIVTSILSFISLPQLEKEIGSKKGRLDYVGAFLATAGLVLLIFAFTSSSEYGWSSATILAPLLISFACLGLFVFVEHKIDNPLMPLSIWKARNFASLWFCGLLLYIWWQTITYYITLICQEVFGLSAIGTSIRLIPIGIVGFFGNILAGYLLQKFQIKWILVIALSGCCLLTIPIPLMSTSPQFHGHQVFTHVLVFACLAPIFISTAYICINTAILLSLPRSEQSLAGGMANTAFQLGCAIGPALSSTIQASSIPSQATKLRQNLSNEGAMMYQFRPPLWFLMAAVGFAALLALATVRNVEEVKEKDVEIQEGEGEKEVANQ